MSTVYSTERGRVCPKCGWPANNCQCGRTLRDEPVPDKVIVKLRMERAGRAGKTVTVVYDLPRNTQFLKDLAQQLKRHCGTGGTVVDDTIELQGDRRDRVRDFLLKKSYIVKG